MIKVIKVKKEFTFKELLDYIFENRVSGKTFSSVSREDMDDKYISVSPMGMLDFSNNLYNIGETYEVEVEEEITKDTEFESVVINTEEFVYSLSHTSIKKSRSRFMKVIEIFARIDGKLQKIWERE